MVIILIKKIKEHIDIDNSIEPIMYDFKHANAHHSTEYIYDNMAERDNHIKNMESIEWCVGAKQKHKYYNPKTKTREWKYTVSYFNCYNKHIKDMINTLNDYIK
jgi:hypothetical protein